MLANITLYGQFNKERGEMSQVESVAGGSAFP